MKKEGTGKGMACPYCKSEMRDGKCLDCGAWADSYGIVHRAKCQGGFHEACSVKGSAREEEGDD